MAALIFMSHRASANAVRCRTRHQGPRLDVLALKKLALSAVRALCIASSVFACSAAVAGELRIPLPADAAASSTPPALVLEAPGHWRSRVHQPNTGLPALIEFKPSAGETFKVLLTVLPARKDAPPLTREAVAAGAARAASKAAERSIEPAPLAIKPLQGAAMFGSYFSATDRQPERDGFRYLTQGTAVIGSVPVAFSVLANDASPSASTETAPSIERAALQMLITARRVP